MRGTVQDAPGIRAKVIGEDRLEGADQVGQKHGRRAIAAVERQPADRRAGAIEILDPLRQERGLAIAGRRDEEGERVQPYLREPGLKIRSGQHPFTRWWWCEFEWQQRLDRASYFPYRGRYGYSRHAVDRCFLRRVTLYLDYSIAKRA